MRAVAAPTGGDRIRDVSGKLQVVHVFLAHHAEALAPSVDSRQPLSPRGREQVERLAATVAARGVKPDVVWHSGKLRGRQTAEAYWRACNPLSIFEATRDLQPADPPSWIRDRLRGEPRDVLIVGHFPHLLRLLALLLTRSDDPPAEFPPHGMVALSSEDEGETWTESWRIENES